MKIVIYARNFYHNNSIKIGGVETYILALVDTFKTSHEVEVIQEGTCEEEIEVEGVRIKTFIAKEKKHLAREILKCVKSNDFLIFSTDQLFLKLNHKKTITIQHGIHWDLPSVYYLRFSNIFANFMKIYDLIRNKYRLKMCERVVCVDYIYPTWMRIITGESVNNFKTILNFSNIAPSNIPREIKEESEVKILFARRFVRIRGVEILIELAKHYSNNERIKFIAAGEGPMRFSIDDAAKKYGNIEVCNVPQNQISRLLDDATITIVPSIGSEGSSLIAAESMAKGVPVIASSVGGLTNIIINKFNGILVSPDSKAFARAIDELLANPEKYGEISKNSIAVANGALSYSEWQNSWRDLINEM